MERLKEFGRYSKRVFSRSKPKKEAAYLNFITDFREEKFSIIWRIENIYRCTLKRGEFLESPSFSAGPSNDVKWTLRFYPVGRKTPENAAQRKPILNEFNVLQMTRSRNPPLTIESRSGLFIKRITEDPVTSSFKYRFVCEVPKQLSNSILKKNTTFLYPNEGTADIVIDSTKSSEYGTDNIFRIFDLERIQTLIVRCEIYVTNAHNMEDSDNNIPDFTKSDSLHQDLKTIYDNGKFYDVTLQVGDTKFPAHKVILAARSSVFDAMFQHDMKESQTNIVHIENIEPTTLGDMLQYMYTGSVDDFKVEKAMSLYPVADKYFLGELKKWCVDIILRNLNVENACQIALLVDLHPDPKLKEATFNMFRNYTGEIFKRREWQDLVRDADRRALVSDILQAVSADFTTNCADVK